MVRRVPVPEIPPVPSRRSGGAAVRAKRRAHSLFASGGAAPRTPWDI
jgi:hypothetical protein